ncbi:uncharacterized protein BX664DRAFT_320236 [Halteromyces radiatus]|uniref:uncharacterized protein n=1 Tax=Halteromyces radiatus TaxID=101107 RepID=UPI0022206215|nr:uncharacterized protein BX664DRAFT_320236 [Halteromyces radiatus]KAI8099037.1 hypothetical protein BX664DRAFT_320236 [Halteromyces radiatus]
MLSIDGILNKTNSNNDNSTVEKESNENSITQDKGKYIQKAHDLVRGPSLDIKHSNNQVQHDTPINPISLIESDDEYGTGTDNDMDIADYIDHALYDSDNEKSAKQQQQSPNAPDNTTHLENGFKNKGRGSPLSLADNLEQQQQPDRMSFLNYSDGGTIFDSPQSSSATFPITYNNDDNDNNDNNNNDNNNDNSNNSNASNNNNNENGIYNGDDSNAKQVDDNKNDKDDSSSSHDNKTTSSSSQFIYHSPNSTVATSLLEDNNSLTAYTEATDKATKSILQTKRTPEEQDDDNYKQKKTRKRSTSTNSPTPDIPVGPLSGSSQGAMVLNYYQDDDTEDGDDDDMEPKYEVEAIRGHKIYRNRVIRYIVKWKGYPDSENTMEPANSFHEDCTDLCLRYWSSLPASKPRPVNIPRDPSAVSILSSDEEDRSEAPKQQRTPKTSRRKSATPIPKSPAASRRSVTPRSTSSTSSTLSKLAAKTTKYARKTKRTRTSNKAISLDDDHDGEDDYGDNPNESCNDKKVTKHDDVWTKNALGDDDDMYDMGNTYSDDVNENEYENDHSDDGYFEPDDKKSRLEKKNSKKPLTIEQNNRIRRNSSSNNSKKNEDDIFFQLAKKKRLVQKHVATNYSDNGYDLAYTAASRELLTHVDWHDEAFTIRNVLRAKGFPSQKLVYLEWSNGLKTAHMIDEIRERSPKKLCLFFEERIKYY